MSKGPTTNVTNETVRRVEPIIHENRPGNSNGFAYDIFTKLCQVLFAVLLES